MIQHFARFAKDSYYLLQTPHSVSRKVNLWLNLIYPSAKMLGFEISAFHQSTIAYLYRDIFARQNYLFRADTESPVIFDCGANLGMATLYFKWLYPKARITAFEPDPNTFTLLKKNVVNNSLRDVITENCALWDENGSIGFFVDPAVPGSLLMSTDQSRPAGTRIQVPSRKLSDFVHEPIDFLKIDVEGAEHRIIRDLVTSGKVEFIKEMVIEYHHHIGNHSSCLAGFLSQLEHAGFEYQVHASLYPVTSKYVFQDVLIGAYRPDCSRVRA
jgi:FkbM family methyltransferase